MYISFRFVLYTVDSNILVKTRKNAIILRFSSHDQFCLIRQLVYRFYRIWRQRRSEGKIFHGAACWHNTLQNGTTCHFLLLDIRDQQKANDTLYALSTTIMQANLLFNSTVNAAASHKTAQLYANTDISQLNWFEQQWVAWYLLFSDPAIATGLMSFLMHEVHFFALLSRSN